MSTVRGRNPPGDLDRDGENHARSKGPEYDDMRRAARRAPINAIRVEQLADKADHAAAVLKAISNKWRLLVLCQLVKGEKPVGELETVIGLSQSALSQHLAVLREHKLVKTRRDAQMIFYSLRGSEAPAILGALYELYCRPPKPVRNAPSSGKQRLSVRSKRSLAVEAGS